MDFSSEVLIDFGLNLAGYLVVALLVYTLLGRRNRSEDKHPGTAVCAAAASAAGSRLPEKAGRMMAAAGDPEFIPLAYQTDRLPDYGDRERTVAVAKENLPVRPLTADTRKENRRAIYQEARRLLASGRSRHDLLRQLPLTEGELEMLSVAGKA